MSNVIYNYPKSSCTCYNCDQDKFPKPTGPPTNMSVRGCEFSEYYDIIPTHPFKIQQEPTQKSGIIVLNSGAVSKDKFNQTYNTINTKDCQQSSCCGTTYLNSDPRLFNAAAGTWLQLNKPPLDSTVKLDTLTTNKALDSYGQGYESYADVNAGQCVYYINREREDAFFEPLFAKKATVVGTVYKDPMGAMKPQYKRIPNEKYNPIINDPCDETDEYCLSFIRDTQFQREDILALQMSKRNEQRYAPRWGKVSA